MTGGHERDQKENTTSLLWWHTREAPYSRTLLSEVSGLRIFEHMDTETCGHPQLLILSASVNNGKFALSRKKPK